MKTKFKITDPKNKKTRTPIWFTRAAAAYLLPDPARGPNERTFNKEEFKKMLSSYNAEIIYSKDKDPASWIKFSDPEKLTAFILRFS